MSEEDVSSSESDSPRSRVSGFAEIFSFIGDNHVRSSTTTPRIRFFTGTRVPSTTMTSDTTERESIGELFDAVRQMSIMMEQLNQLRALQRMHRSARARMIFLSNLSALNEEHFQADVSDSPREPRSLDEILLQYAIQISMSSAPTGSAPATKEDMDNLERRTLSREDPDILAQNKCSICLERYLIGSKVIQLPCEHLFCQTCVLTWLEKNRSCPICRTEVANVPRKESGAQVACSLTPETHHHPTSLPIFTNHRFHGSDDERPWQPSVASVHTGSRRYMRSSSSSSTSSSVSDVPLVPYPFIRNSVPSTTVVPSQRYDYPASETTEDHSVDASFEGRAGPDMSLLSHEGISELSLESLEYPFLTNHGTYSTRSSATSANIPSPTFHGSPHQRVSRLTPVNAANRLRAPPMRTSGSSLRPMNNTVRSHSRIPVPTSQGLDSLRMSGETSASSSSTVITTRLTDTPSSLARRRVASRIEMQRVASTHVARGSVPTTRQPIHSEQTPSAVRTSSTTSVASPTAAVNATVGGSSSTSISRVTRRDPALIAKRSRSDLRKR